MRARLGALALVLAVALTACGPQGLEVFPAPTPSETASPSPTPAPAGPEELTLAYDLGGGWDPYGEDLGLNRSLLGLLCEGLYELDETFAPQPVLARSAAQSEDGGTWYVELRDDVTFADGAPLTAQAAAQAVRLAQGEGSPYANRLRGVTVEAGGETTLTFLLPQPNRDFLALLDFPIARTEEGKLWGTGPYALELEEEALVARADWWRGGERPAERIALVGVSGEKELMSALDEGRVTLAAPDLTAPNALGWSGAFESWEYQTSTMVFLGYRCDGGPCGEAGVRRALGRAWDRSAAVTGALGGHASVASLPVPPTAQRYETSLAARLGYDPAAAAEALDALGWLPGEDGTRQNAEGEPLALRLVVNSGNAFKEKLALQAARDLEAVGIRVETVSLPWEEYLAALEAGEFDLYLGECRLTGDLDLLPFLTPGSGLCYGGFDPAALLAARERAQETGDWWHFLYAWSQEAPFGVLCFKTGSVFARWDCISGLHPTQGNVFFDLGEIRLPEG